VPGYTRQQMPAMSRQARRINQTKPSRGTH
jgi:hypothetical protein